jgi:DNA polymerase III alpha subunit (gram-positive type)
MFTVQPLGFDGELVMQGKRAVDAYIKDIEKRGNDASPKEQQSLPVLQLVNEAYARGIKFLPVDLEKSSDREYLPEDGKIRLPFSSLAGVGDNAAANIVAARNDEPFFSVDDLQTRAKLTKSVIEILRRKRIHSARAASDDNGRAVIDSRVVGLLQHPIEKAAQKNTAAELQNADGFCLFRIVLDVLHLFLLVYDAA